MINHNKDFINHLIQIHKIMMLII